MSKRLGVITGDNSFGHNKIKRVMILILALKNGRYSVDELMSILEASQRSVYRYLHLLQSLEFEIECDFDKKYFITSECPFCGNCNQQPLMIPKGRFLNKVKE